MFPRPGILAAIVCLLGVASAFLLVSHCAKLAHAGVDRAPAYAPNGDLLPPKEYREWIYVSTGIDMSYSPQAMDMQGQSVFDNIFVNPAAYRSFVARGTWPDKTMMVLEHRNARSKGSINQHGHFQDVGPANFEVHIKDESRFPGEWAFFSFDSPDKNGTLIPHGAPCYTCHAAHAAVDMTFVQFYPTLLPIAKAKGTLAAGFLKEEAADSSK